MLLLLSALIVAAAVVWAGLQIVDEMRTSRADMARRRRLQLLAVFAPAVAAAEADPRAVLTWQPLARTARQLFPEDFGELDRASGAIFPFGKESLQAAHARWTTDWLAWERTHDAEFKLKAAIVEHELTESGGSPLVRARLEAVEREKLDQYQRRYEEYVRVAKALQGMASDQ